MAPETAQEISNNHPAVCPAELDPHMLTNKSKESGDHDLDRHWFSDEYFDLIVWYESGNHVHGFQLCYDKPGRERALTWTRGRGFVHTVVDSGESTPTENRTPILIADGAFPALQVRREFICRSASLPTDICELVLALINEFEDQQTTLPNGASGGGNTPL
jgi:hypothetical protein